MPAVTVRAAGEVASCTYELGSAKYGPVSYKSVAEARAEMGAPADARYVTWPTGAVYLQDALKGLGANDILVLPERDEPYLIDTSDGFRAPGFVSTENADGTRQPVKSANMWFAMARATRGIIGMGPRSVIRLSESAFTQPAQKSPPMNVVSLTAEQQRRAFRADGSFMVLSGAQEKLIESDTAGAFFGNFHAYGRDLGGVAYTGLSLAKGGTIVNFDPVGFGAGFSGVPNGEAGAIAFGGGTYRLENVDIDSRDENGRPLGASPIMWNRSTGGTMLNVRARFHRAGMPAMWNSTGIHDWRDVTITDGHQVGINMEKNRGGLTLNWTGGALSAAPGQYHFILNSSDGTSQKVTVADVAFTGGRAGDGVMTSHGYQYAGEVKGQKAADVVRVTAGARTPAALNNTGPNRAFGTIY